MLHHLSSWLTKLKWKPQTWSTFLNMTSMYASCKHIPHSEPPANALSNELSLYCRWVFSGKYSQKGGNYTNSIKGVYYISVKLHVPCRLVLSCLSCGQKPPVAVKQRTTSVTYPMPHWTEHFLLVFIENHSATLWC